MPQEINDAKVLVDWQRGKTEVFPFNEIFVNWPEVLLRDRIGVIFENLDIGNYFFKGHPRERVGVEEKQKFYFFHLILFVFGFFSKEIKRFRKFLIIYTVIALIFAFIFKWREANQTIFFSVPLILIMGLGAKNIFLKIWIRLN